MKKIIFLTIVLTSMLLFSHVGATDYYVRPTGGSYGLRNGTSYENAWAGFSNIAWATVDNGNGTLWVDGTNTEKLTIGASGENGAPIIVQAFSSSAQVQCIYMSNKSYITIDGLRVTGCPTDPGIVADDPSTNNITIKNARLDNNFAAGYTSWNAGSTFTIDNCLIGDNGSDATYHHDGIYYHGTGGLTIKNSTFFNNGKNDPASSRDLSHAIYIGEGSGSPIDIYNNIIYSHLKGNGLQSKSSVHAYNNTIYNNWRAGIMIGQNTGNIIVDIQNNIIYKNGDQAIGIYSLGSYSSVINIYNNSTYKNNTNGSGAWYGELFIDDSVTTLNIKNNIFYANTDDYTISLNANQSGMTADYNIHYGSSGNPIYYGGVGRSWNYWRTTLGRDANGYNVDPKYSNPPTNMTLQSSSPGISINAGAYAPGGVPPPNRIPSTPIIQVQ